MASSEALRKAAEEGDAEAQYQLGLIYVYGNDEPKDAAKAFEWMSRAAAQNVVPAKRELGIMLVSGEGTEPDIPRGVQLLSEAADMMKVSRFPPNVKPIRKKPYLWAQWCERNLLTVVHLLNPLTAHSFKLCLNM